MDFLLQEEVRLLPLFYHSVLVFNIQGFDKVLLYNLLTIPILSHKIIISSLKMLNMSLLGQSTIKLSL